MISAPDRRATLSLIEAARAAGARLSAVGAELGLSARTVQRWSGPDGSVREDARPTAVRPTPANRLSDAERDRIAATCNAPEFASLPPGQIVPRLADRGEYIGSESTMYRVLRERGQAGRRGRARAPRASRPPTTHRAAGPCQVWSWDITWLPGPALGMFFYRYLILDIWSRKITGWEVYDRENGALAAQVVEKAVWAEGCVTRPLTLHADNGSPMKAATLRVTLERLGVTASYSRPRVSNDNPFSEALLRTCKYVPSWPERGFESLEAARAWVANFVRYIQWRAPPQRAPLRHPRPAPPPAGPRHPQPAPCRLSGRPRPPPRTMVRPYALLATHRRRMAEPRTARPGAQRPWGRRRAPTQSWRRRPHGRPAAPDHRMKSKPEATTTLTDADCTAARI